MIAFGRPSFTYRYDAARERRALRRYRDNTPGRAIPAKRNDRLLIATWNIANLGLQRRDRRDYQLLAEIVSWFDLVAVQEVYDDLDGLRRLLAELPRRWEAVFSDRGGNDERSAFVFDSQKVAPLEMAGEVAIPPSEHRYIRLPGITTRFPGFDRNPYVYSFSAGSMDFALANVHFYYGGDTAAHRRRRTLEAYAVARWADLRHNDRHAYTPNIVVLGDMNMPHYAPGDPIYEAMRRRGLRRPTHRTRIHTNIVGTHDYDQLMFFPALARRAATGEIGIFDFDGGVFSHVWNTRTQAQFRSFVRYHLSDHRPHWAEFRI